VGYVTLAVLVIMFMRCGLCDSSRFSYHVLDSVVYVTLAVLAIMFRLCGLCDSSRFGYHV
jgi:hypothetical protein